MPKPKKKKAISRKTLQNRMDKAWSKAIKDRAGHKCEKCGKTAYKKDIVWKSGPKKGKADTIIVPLNSHHIIRRSVKVLRWDLGNGLCLCPGCHTRLAHSESYLDQLEYHDWLTYYWMDTRYQDFGPLSEMITKAEILGSKALPMGMMHSIDFALKMAVK